MHFDYKQLAEGGRQEIADCDDGCHGDGVRVVVGFGRGCILYGKAAPVTVLVPLKGHIQLSEGEMAYTMAPGQLLIAEGGQKIQVIGRGPALWVAVLASANAWRALTGASVVQPGLAPILLPGTHDADHVIRRGLIALVRAVADSGNSNSFVHAVAASVAIAISDLQSKFDSLIERCPGRTHAQRRSIFLRLHRVRNLMMTSCHLELDLADCARMASYSPYHFIRVFDAVYGETPHALLVEQRLRHAHRLLHSSMLAIAEVARVSGFENRCAFARSFKRRFGITAADLRLHYERRVSLQTAA